MPLSIAKSRRAALACLAAAFAALAIAACASPPQVPAPASPPPPTIPPSQQNALDPQSCPDDGHCALFHIGGQLLAAAWLDSDRMYITDWNGQIRLLNINTGDIAVVAQGLAYPQGLTVLNGRLYASDMGNACDLAREYGHAECRWWPEPSDDAMELLSRIDSRILSYAIAPGGRLSDPQVIIDRLVSRDIEHSPNGLTNDGEYIYASVGSMLLTRAEAPQFEKIIQALGSRRPRTDLSGAVFRFRPPDREPEIYASGFRNIYGISIAPDGTLYGADNDGTRGYREELNAIAQNGFYGYPKWGTNKAPPSENVTEPVAVLSGKKASTFALASDEGVYVASRIPQSEEPIPRFVVDRYDYGEWTPKRVFYATAFATAILERNNLLYIVLLSGDIHVINPNSSALPIYDRSKEIRYADRIIAQPDAYRLRQGPPGYDLYLDGGKLIYNKTQCSAEDAALRFFLHITPANPDDLAEQSRARGFDNLDFWLADHSGRVGNRCLAVIDLPEYPIAEIDTGQFVESNGRYSRVWQAKHSP